MNYLGTASVGPKTRLTRTRCHIVSDVVLEYRVLQKNHQVGAKIKVLKKKWNFQHYTSYSNSDYQFFTLSMIIKCSEIHKVKISYFCDPQPCYASQRIAQ